MPVTVNGETIDEALIEAEADRLRPHYDHHVRPINPDASDEQLLDWARENMVEHALLRQEAARQSIEVPSEEIDALYEQVKDRVSEGEQSRVRADIELQLQTERLVAQISDRIEPPSKEEIESHYDENRDEFVSPEQVRASHIIRHVNQQVDQETAEQQIAEIKKRLEDGADFDELARECSDCADGAGDLGYFPRGQMVEEFEQVVFSLEVGQFSDPFLTPFGYHIAKLTDRRPSGPVPLAELQDGIAKELLEAKRTKAFEDFIDDLKGQATIEAT